jgi:cell division protein ZapA
MADNTHADEPTPVTIFGRTYHLRGGADPQYLGTLAARVDSKMREVADATGTADTLKVAILASLNLADDNLDAGGGRSDDSKRDDETAARLANLVTRLDEVLAEPDHRLP